MKESPGMGWKEHIKMGDVKVNLNGGDSTATGMYGGNTLHYQLKDNRRLLRRE